MMWAISLILFRNFAGTLDSDGDDEHDLGDADSDEELDYGYESCPETDEDDVEEEEDEDEGEDGGEEGLYEAF